MHSRMMWLAGAAALFVIGTTPGQARAASSKAHAARGAKPGRARLSAEDAKFLKQATEGARAEITMGRLVVKRAEGQDVKNLGQRMIDDHGKELQQLEQLDKSKGMRPPTSIDPKAAQFMKTKLSKLNGEKFDRAYATYAVKDHTKDIEDYRKEAKNGKDSDVKAFAAKMLPTLQEHLKLAKQTAGAEKGEKKAEKR